MKNVPKLLLAGPLGWFEKSFLQGLSFIDICMDSCRCDMRATGGKGLGFVRQADPSLFFPICKTVRRVGPLHGGLARRRPD